VGKRVTKTQCWEEYQTLGSIFCDRSINSIRPLKETFLIRWRSTTVADINKRLDLFEQNYANLKGVTKEIDEVRERVRDIEKHLGLNKKIAA